MFDPNEITGRTRTHVIQLESPRFAAHPEAAAAFLSMRAAAARDGIDLVPFSAFRDFKTQLRIWNHKYVGKKPLYDRAGRVRDRAGLDEDELIWHILDWSALPGASRHHWGTEIDIIDRAAVSPDYQVQLLPAEVAPGGPFHPLHCWLDEHLAEFGFFRPYHGDCGGMFPEPWHLSFAPVAQQAIKDLSVALLAEVLAATEIEGKKRILELLPAIYTRHIQNYRTPLFAN